MADSKDQVGQALASSIHNFTHDFYKNVAGKTEGNFVSSALSAHVVLAMTAYGADGSTAEEMRKVLHLPEKDEQAHQEFQSFIEAFKNVPDVDLKIANKICVSDQISIKDRFKEITSKFFHSEHAIFDFLKAAESVQNINDWCLEKTNGKIKDVIKEADLSGLTALILLNAVYFKGNWKHKFDVEATQMRPFHVNNVTTIQVPTMYITKKYKYKEIPELSAQCVRLPYVNEDLYMELIVPKEIDGLQKIEQNLDKITSDDFYTTEICLALPKFKIETEIDLNEHLVAMGMREMFTDNAQFNNMADAKLKVSKVKQKAFIEVNEEGSEAAAVTGMRMMLCSMPLPPKKICVDKPFIYKIVHKNVTLFAGRIADPSKE